MMRSAPERILLLVTGRALRRSDEFRAEHRYCCRRRSRGLMQPSNNESDSHDRQRKYWQQPNDGTKPKLRRLHRRWRLWQVLSRCCGARLAISRLFFLAQPSTLLNDTLAAIAAHNLICDKSPIARWRQQYVLFRHVCLLAE